MIYPNTKATVAQVVTQQVTAPEAAVLHFVYRNRAVHACELKGFETIVLQLLSDGLLHCRRTRIGQLISMTPQGNVQISQSEMRVIAPSVGMNVVYHRAALKLASGLGYRMNKFLNPQSSLIEDGFSTHLMLINASTGGPSGDTIKRAIAYLKSNYIWGNLFILADDKSRYDYHIKRQAKLVVWELRNEDIKYYLTPF